MLTFKKKGRCQMKRLVILIIVVLISASTAMAHQPQRSRSRTMGGRQDYSRARYYAKITAELATRALIQTGHTEPIPTFNVVITATATTDGPIQIMAEAITAHVQAQTSMFAITNVGTVWAANVPMNNRLIFWEK